MRKLLSKGLRRLGLVPNSTIPGLLFYGTGQHAFEAIAPLLEQLAKTDLRLKAVLCTGDAELFRRLERTFPNTSLVAPPIRLSLLTTIFLKRSRIRTVVLLKEGAFPSPTFRACLKKRSTPIALLADREQTRPNSHHMAKNGDSPSLTIDQNPNDNGLIDLRLAVLPPITGQLDETSTSAVLDQIIPLLGRNQKWANRRDRPLSRLLGRLLHQRLDQAGFAKRCRRFIQRYNDQDQLREALGHPETILCLGNGPSSEHPDLSKVSYDALFRVNHSWMNRTILTEPHVVFTGGYPTMRALNKATIFGLQNETGEMMLLMTRGLRIFQHRLRYFSMERLGRFLQDFDWDQHRPTNGAGMIAMAVALKPKRLIIAGIDLFRHPEGSYPGDNATPNAYKLAHSLDKELAFMFHHLDRFQGEVVIFGEILDREWRQFRERHQHHLDEVG